jgi:pseudouridine-5'-phosphate glycosidase/pseudouridine kinase
LESGIAIFNPIPQEHAIPQAEMEIVISAAVRECEELGVTGKDITPFLLQRVVAATKGRSLDANIGLIQDNARVGAKIAITLAALENPSSFQPAPTNMTLSQSARPETVETVVDIMVIGSMAADLTCTLSDISFSSLQLQTSIPSEMHTSAGGVAHNVALAASYTTTRSVRLVTALGSDPQGAWLREYAENVGLNVGFLPGRYETARYVAIHDKHGELVTATADMKIIEGLNEQDVRREIQRGKPKWLAFDGNLSSSSVKVILEETNSNARGKLKEKGDYLTCSSV